VDLKFRRKGGDEGGGWLRRWREAGCACAGRYLRAANKAASRNPGRGYIGVAWADQHTTAGAPPPRRGASAREIMAAIDSGSNVEASSPTACAKYTRRPARTLGGLTLIVLRESLRSRLDWSVQDATSVRIHE